MDDLPEVIELEVSPIPPETIDSCKAELIPLIEEALLEAGQESMLSQEHMNIQIAKAFPTDAAIIVVLTLASGIVLETYKAIIKAIIIPALEKRFNVKVNPKPK